MELIKAVEDGRLEDVKRMIKKGVDINYVDQIGLTALMHAIINNRLDIVKFLVRNGADVNHVDRFEFTPLIRAVINNRLDIVKFLVKNGADINYAMESYGTAFQIASMKDFFDIVKYFIDNGYHMSHDDARRLRNKFIQPDNPRDVSTDIEKIFAMIYKQYPKLVLQYKLNIDYQKHISKECRNTTLITDTYQLFKDENGVTWCFSDDDIAHIKQHGRNPYNGKKISDSWWTTNNTDNTFTSIDPNICGRTDLTIKNFTPQTQKVLTQWVEEVVTLGNVYFKIPYDVQYELAYTRPCQLVTLYRGMSFKTKEMMDTFIRANSCDDDANKVCFYSSDTFSSWTDTKKIAKNFAKYFKNGIVMEAQFNTDDVLVDLRQISGLEYDNEREVVILPGRYRLINVDIL